jgi:serine/threonine protein kinase
MDAHPLTQPNLDFLAPEITTSMSCSPASDMFALGMLTYTAFNSGKPVFSNRGDWNRHRQNIIVVSAL